MYAEFCVNENGATPRAEWQLSEIRGASLGEGKLISCPRQRFHRTSQIIVVMHDKRLSGQLRIRSSSLAGHGPVLDDGADDEMNAESSDALTVANATIAY